MEQFTIDWCRGYVENEGTGLHIHFHAKAGIDDVGFTIDNRRRSWCQFQGVHSGMADVANSAMAFLLPMIRGKKPLRVTGYSLGAGVTVLVGAACQALGRATEIEVCGCPRVGGLRWVLATRKMRITRHEILGDPLVTRGIFQAGSLAPWWHVGRRFVYNSERHWSDLHGRHEMAAYQPMVNYPL